MEKFENGEYYNTREHIEKTATGHSKDDRVKSVDGKQNFKAKYSNKHIDKDKNTIPQWSEMSSAASHSKDNASKCGHKEQTTNTRSLTGNPATLRSISSPTIPVLNDRHKFGSTSDSNYKVYKSRWWLLFIVAVLNISNTLMMMTFAPAADTFIAFYEISTFQLNILSMVFMIVSIPVGFLASWVIDTRGLRQGLILSAWLNGTGGLVRNVSHFGIVPKSYSYAVLLIGQIMAACAQPFVLFAPTKLAALWFPESRRATANMIGSMARIFGIMAAFLLVPFLVRHASDIPLVLYSISVPAWIVTLIATFGVQRSKPPTPPSPSAGQKDEHFKSGLKQLLTDKNYIVINMVVGNGQAMAVALMYFLLQILCPRGYSDDFTGLCGTLMMASGIVISPFVSLYIDKTKKFEETLKIGYTFVVLSGILFTQVSRLRDQHILIAISISLFGGILVSLFPVAMEFLVEITYPVAAATSSGFAIIGGQLQTIIIMLGMQYAAQPLSQYERQLESGCYNPEDSSSVGIDPLDWTYPNLYIFNVLSTFWCVIFLLYSSPAYKRLEMEKRIATEALKQTDCQIAVVSNIYSTHL